MFARNPVSVASKPVAKPPKLPSSSGTLKTHSPIPSAGQELNMGLTGEFGGVLGSSGKAASRGLDQPSEDDVPLPLYAGKSVIPDENRPYSGGVSKSFGAMAGRLPAAPSPGRKSEPYTAPSHHDATNEISELDSRLQALQEYLDKARTGASSGYMQ